MENKNWNSFVEMMQKHDRCIGYSKETKFCKKHNNKQLCLSVFNHHDELRHYFELIKNEYNFKKLNLGQGRHTITPWISFKAFEKNVVYPCIIFSDKKKPYLTIQVENQDTISPIKDKQLPTKVIQNFTSWLKTNQEFDMKKFKFNGNVGCLGKYNSSDVISKEATQEEEIIDFYSNAKEIFEIKDYIYKVILYEDYLSNDEGNKLFFTTNNSNFENLVRKEINNFKEVILFPFTKLVDKKNEYLQLPVYKINELPNIEEEKNNLVYELLLLSPNFADPINTINKYKKNKVIINKFKVDEASRIVNNAGKLTLEDIQDKIAKYNFDITQEDSQTQRVHKVYKRRRSIKELSLAISEGYCQLCEKYAPFSNQNNTRPFLESDHIHELNLGGKDIIDNVIALCPNCHRKKTYWDDKQGKINIVKTLKTKNKNLLIKWKNKEKTL